MPIAAKRLMRAPCRLSTAWLANRRPTTCRAINLGKPASAAFPSQRRSLLTLAIETSCDDTCVAILGKDPTDGTARLYHNSKRTSDNRAFGGVHPVAALAGHGGNLADMVSRSLAFLPDAEVDDGRSRWENESRATLDVQGRRKQKPDFVSVTRGPGMLANLSAGLNTAKGIAAAWQVPLVGVNHMQAHALTPRLVVALRWGEEQLQQEQRVREVQEEQAGGEQRPGREGGSASVERPVAAKSIELEPAFPFLSLLVSGGHTLLVHSRELNDHRILASTTSLAVGDAIDKAARAILPKDVVERSDDVMYGRLLESFAFPPAEPGHDHEVEYVPPRRRADEVKTYESPTGWRLSPPLAQSRAMQYDFAGFGSQVQRIMDARPDMPVDERRVLAREVMRLLFEHLASRVVFALDDPALLGVDDSNSTSEDHGSKGHDAPKADIVETLVVSGGVASNRFLMRILRAFLDARGHEAVDILAPPPALCTDNAAMIAWAGMEMYEAGYESELSVMSVRKWPLDPTGQDGGILGVPGWIRHGGKREA